MVNYPKMFGKSRLVMNFRFALDVHQAFVDRIAFAGMTLRRVVTWAGFARNE